MFPRMNITTPLPSFAYCAPQYGPGVGFGVINPIASHMASPYVNAPSPIPYPMIGQNPYAVQPVIGQNPYAVQPVIGQNPYAVQPMLPCPPGLISAGIGGWCPPLSLSPYAVAQAAQAYPAIAPAFAPAFGAAAPAFASSPFASSPFASSPFASSPFASSPVACCIDPVTGAVVPSPYPAAQSLLPIRPLVAATQPDPVQMAALCGMMGPQVADPYSVMAQACLTSPLAVSPVQSALRPPVYLSPVGSPQIGIPCTVAGIPCQV